LVYFEGIRTNGVGVLSIREQLANDLNELDCPLAVSGVKYQSDNYNINSVTEGIVLNLYEIMSSKSIALKCKCKVYCNNVFTQKNNRDCRQ
jgi:rRNA maturation endonuclease Nob1